MATAAYRKRKRLFETDSSTTTTINWGDYDINIPTRGSKGAKELHGFLSRLESVAHFPQIKKEEMTKIIREVMLQTPSKYEAFIQIFPKFLNIPPDDLILLTDNQSLRKALQGRFRVPLLHRATIKSPSLGINPAFSVQEFLDRLSANQKKDAKVSVYNYSIHDPKNRTYQIALDELVEIFESNNDTALNFLDIENRFSTRFCPSPISDEDIKNKISDQISNQDDIGKTSSTWQPKIQQEFFLLSLKNAISSIHVDIGGHLTWILILTGRKIWYYPREITTQAVRWLAMAGSQTPEYYSQGWIKVELRPGDLL
jgi:hypothetical protein